MIPAVVYEAPGRVNLIGEFTDYNDGFVLPAALRFSTRIHAAPRPDRMLSVRSENFGESREFDLDDPRPEAGGHWSDYVCGVAVALQQSGLALRGADLMIRGDVPVGAGLSSSAPLEVATARALLGISGLSLDPTQLARLCQRAENEFVGMQCGIMDQFVACRGAPGEALMLDCRSLDYRLVRLPPQACIVICNTMVHHELARSEYNQRRRECMAGVEHLARALRSVTALRDVTVAELEQCGSGLSGPVFRRCRHVVNENERVQQACSALEAGNLRKFGDLMRASHLSLRDDFEASCRELDLLVAIAGELPGVYGSRMTGGGFGGCTVNLLQRESADAFCEIVQREYRKTTGIAPSIYR